LDSLTFSISIPCPWCKRGETLVDTTATVHISCRCYECGRFYNIDLLNKRAEKATPIPKARSPARCKVT